MSKVANAKSLQGYIAKVVPNTCSICQHRVPVTAQVLRYIDPFLASEGTHYVTEEVGQKCGIGGFSVKRLGCCNQFSPKVQV